MHGSCNLKNPINLFSLSREKRFNDLDFDFILKNDIWCNGTLILRSGNYLSKEIIKKLINFGIYEVNICLENDLDFNDELNEFEEFKTNFLKSQNAVIFDNNQKNIKSLTQMLNFIGFKPGRIFSQNHIKSFIKILNSIKPFYIFMSYDLYKESGKNIISKLELPENLTIFIIFNGIPLNKKKLRAEIEGKRKDSQIKIIFKPVLAATLRKTISEYIEKHFEKLFKSLSVTKYNSLRKIN